jgi:hypothetical protein
MKDSGCGPTTHVSVTPLSFRYASASRARCRGPRLTSLPATGSIASTMTLMVGLKVARFSLIPWLSLGCRLMVLGPGLGTLAGTLKPTPLCAYRAHIVLR